MRIVPPVAGIIATLMLSTPAAAAPIAYPEVPRGDVVDDYHGTAVADPYRWLEDLTSPEVKAYVEAQNAITFDYLGQIEGRDRLLARMTQLVNYERWGAPVEQAGRWFFHRNDGLQNHTPLYWSDRPGEDERLLIDPNAWSEDGSISLQTWEPSPDGKLLLYARSSSGSDWSQFVVQDVETGELLPDSVQWAKFANGAWDAVGAGFYYLRFPEPLPGEEYSGANVNPQIMYHRLGTEQSADELIFSIPEYPEWWTSFGLNDERTLMGLYVSAPGSINNRYYLRELDKPGRPLHKLFDAEDANYSFVGNDGARLFFTTNKDAPNGRLIEVTLDAHAPEQWKTVIHEQAEPLQSVGYVGGAFFARYLKDSRTVVEKYDLSGNRLLRVPLPGFGTATGFGGRKWDKELYFSYTDYTTPATIYRYEIATDEIEVWRAPSFPADTSRYESRLLFSRSPDGTAVPIFVMHRRDLELSGLNPTILSAYGGFRSAQQPSFSSSRLAWLDMGGVYAFAGIRGGGEYGQPWYEAGIRHNRQNSFNDLVAAAEYLIDSGYTSTPRLAIYGGSQGGMLVTAVEMQRPDLFGVVIAQVPVADMLRFNQFTAGRGWMRDYGDPQDPVDFPLLRGFSPYHNVTPGTCFPATIITTGDTDDRVVPSHSFKLAAAMQAAQGCERPVLLRVETAAGHGAGKPLAKSLEELADIYAFALHNMGVPIPSFE